MPDKLPHAADSAQTPTEEADAGKPPALMSRPSTQGGQWLKAAHQLTHGSSPTFIQNSIAASNLTIASGSAHFYLSLDIKQTASMVVPEGFACGEACAGDAHGLQHASGTQLLQDVGRRQTAGPGLWVGLDAPAVRTHCQLRRLGALQITTCSLSSCDSA